MSRVLLVCIFACSPVAWAQDSQTAIDYQRQIKPILEERCFACHGALKQEADLRVDTIRSMLDHQGGSILISGNAAQSPLYQRISATDNSRMPPEGHPLTDDQIALISQWIDRGIQTMDDEQPQADPRMHWAFQPIRKPRLDRPKHPESEHPESAEQAIVHPIDQLLRPMQQQMNVKPLGQADRQTLIRRLYLDLLGIPPTPLEVDQFLADDSVTAYERLVDSILERPEHGERWARHWMDVWRYSDWYGRRNVPDVMNSYPQIWRWRDWIVRSLNQDKGYDQMIREMLAADEVHPSDPEELVATGFLVRNWYKWNYETWMKDNVEHTAKAFLGLTMNCAMCHDHKYDPISQEDYFRFRAFFEPLELRHERLAGTPDPGTFKKYVYAESYGPIAHGAIRVFDEKLDAKTWMFRGGDARNRIEEKGPIDPSPPIDLLSQPFTVQPLTLPTEAWYPGLRADLRQEERDRARRNLEENSRKRQEKFEAYQQAISRSDTSSQSLTASSTAQPSSDAIFELQWQSRLADASLSVARASLRSVEYRLDADEARYLRNDIEPERQLELARRAHLAEKQHLYEQAFEGTLQSEWNLIQAQRLQLEATSKDNAAKDASKDGAAKDAATASVERAKQSLDAARLRLDAARQNMTVVEPNYTPFSAQYPKTSTGRRTALVNWIVDPGNPLTARVAVNQIWLKHFGQAIVDTTENFGVQGKHPSHPELVDWLAAELIEHDWSIKHMHRAIVTSQAYRRSSDPKHSAHPNLENDHDNRAYWRFPIRRMEAEVIRDSLLCCSQLLDTTQGGPEIDMNQWSTSFRRSLYFSSHGETRMQFMETFDGPNVNECYRRSSTILPQQALAMTNGELSVHCGRVLASKLRGREGLDSVDQGDSQQQFIDAAFRQILGRSAKPEEIQIALDFLTEQSNILSRASVEQLRQPSNPGVIQASSEIAQRARENLVISLFSHNDFVTIR